ncbi:DUF2946 family protein [Massilia sp. 9I]|uniref:DUF2946 family protein n=1 Tax=Massilia sp. 9I TaxID=2653152 RepID=UPI0012F214BA|nr:DUF2946 family protein [Massilia sp. 9I]VXB42422.1 conserved exported hypothetical protein [Massilia sp. 9I]
MKRYFLILLIVLLPLQFSWALAGTYCAHEQESSSQHFGHHVHKHDKADEGAKDASQKVKPDLDCDYCHHVPASAMVPADAPIGARDPTVHARFELPTYVSHIPDLIPRPDW